MYVNIYFSDISNLFFCIEVVLKSGRREARAAFPSTSRIYVIRAHIYIYRYILTIWMNGRMDHK
jgi:hypothetical protein